MALLSVRLSMLTWLLLSEPLPVAAVRADVGADGGAIVVWALLSELWSVLLSAQLLEQLSVLMWVLLSVLLSELTWVLLSELSVGRCGC